MSSASTISPFTQVRIGTGVRKTGPDRKTVELVRERADNLCEICGLSEGQQLHHRKPRRAGGTRDPAINYPSNLIFACALCHALVESKRERAIEEGHVVPSFGDPASIPVLYRGTMRLLDNEGGFVRIAY
jgi:5-methylcytosine-specific restriction protein A